MLLSDHWRYILKLWKSECEVFLASVRPLVIKRYGVDNIFDCVDGVVCFVNIVQSSVYRTRHSSRPEQLSC
jgi:hypothetical protein